MSAVDSCTELGDSPISQAGDFATRSDIFGEIASPFDPGRRSLDDEMRAVLDSHHQEQTSNPCLSCTDRVRLEPMMRLLFPHRRYSSIYFMIVIMYLAFLLHLCFVVDQSPDLGVPVMSPSQRRGLKYSQ
jgi:hypothetical protein